MWEPFDKSVGKHRPGPPFRPVDSLENVNEVGELRKLQKEKTYLKFNIHDTPTCWRWWRRLNICFVWSCYFFSDSAWNIGTWPGTRPRGGGVESRWGPLAIILPSVPATTKYVRWAALATGHVMLILIICLSDAAKCEQAEHICRWAMPPQVT